MKSFLTLKSFYSSCLHEFSDAENTIATTTKRMMPIKQFCNSFLVAIGLLAPVILAGCNNHNTLEKIRSLNDQILRDENLLKCIKEEVDTTCFSLFDRGSDLRELGIIEINHHSEVNKSMEPLDFCIAYKLKNAKDDETFLLYLYAGAAKYKSKYQSYEQYQDGSAGFEPIDSLWSVGKNFKTGD